MHLLTIVLYILMLVSIYFWPNNSHNLFNLQLENLVVLVWIIIILGIFLYAFYHVEWNKYVGKNEKWYRRVTVVELALLIMLLIIVFIVSICFNKNDNFWYSITQIIICYLNLAILSCGSICLLRFLNYIKLKYINPYFNNKKIKKRSKNITTEFSAFLFDLNWNKSSFYDVMNYYDLMGFWDDLKVKYGNNKETVLNNFEIFNDLVEEFSNLSLKELKNIDTYLSNDPVTQEKIWKKLGAIASIIAAIIPPIISGFINWLTSIKWLTSIRWLTQILNLLQSINIFWIIYYSIILFIVILMFIAIYLGRKNRTKSSKMLLAIIKRAIDEKNAD